MSHSINNNVTGVNICTVCSLTFEPRKEQNKQNLKNEHSKAVKE